MLESDATWSPDCHVFFPSDYMIDLTSSVGYPEHRPQDIRECVASQTPMSSSPEATANPRGPQRLVKYL